MPKRIRGFQKGNKYGSKRKGKSNKIEVICQYCGKSFRVYPYQIKRGGGKYHSPECYRLSKIGKKNTEDHNKNISKSKNGKNNPNWKGGNLRGEYKKREYNKLKNNLKYQLNNKIKFGIWHSLKGNKNGRSWLNLVPYTLKQLKKRLQSIIPLGYTWQDFLNGLLHIDHIRPISSFNFSKPEDIEFQQCWALNNLRLLPKRENLKKGAKLIEPFQEILNIAI